MNIRINWSLNKKFNKKPMNHFNDFLNDLHRKEDHQTEYDCENVPQTSNKFNRDQPLSSSIILKEV